jgi:hypothetical protein
MTRYGYLYSTLDELISQTDAKGKKPVLSYEKKNQMVIAIFVKMK